MASTDHGLGAYEDDWTLPEGMSRGIYWVLQTDMDHYVQLGPDGIDQIADWLAYVWGDKTWDWATDGEVYEA